MSLLMASLRPAFVTNPSRADISCSTIAANMAKKIAHNKAKENIFPARRQTVTVPGPINAAVTSIPGPMDLKKLNFILKNCTFD